MKKSIHLFNIVLFFWATFCQAQQQDINPHVDTLAIARYPLTNTGVLHKISIHTIKNYHGETSARILQSLVLNPKSADSTLCNIAMFLLKKPALDEDLLLTLASHKNITKNTYSVIAEKVIENKNLNMLYRYCTLRIKEIKE